MPLRTIVPPYPTSLHKLPMVEGLGKHHNDKDSPRKTKAKSLKPYIFCSLSPPIPKSSVINNKHKVAIENKWRMTMKPIQVRW